MLMKAASSEGTLEAALDATWNNPKPIAITSGGVCVCVCMCGSEDCFLRGEGDTPAYRKTEETKC